MWIVCEILADFLLSILCSNEKSKCRPIGNKGSKHQPIEEKALKNCFDCEMLNFALTIRIHDSCGKLKMDLMDLVNTK